MTESLRESYAGVVFGANGAIGQALMRSFQVNALGLALLLKHFVPLLVMMRWIPVYPRNVC